MEDLCGSWFFPFRIKVALDVFYTALIMLRCSLQSNLCQDFYHKCMFNFVNTASTEITMWFLFLSAFIWFMTFIVLHVLNYSCLSGTMRSWSLWMIFWCVPVCGFHIFWEFLHYFFIMVWVCRSVGEDAFLLGFWY